MTRYLGCHVSVAGGFEAGVKNGVELGINTIQVHPSPPQRWNSKPYAEGYEAEFMKARKNSEITKVFFHGIYLINLATPDSQKFHLGKMSLVHYLDLSARVEGEGVIFHVGSKKDQPDEKTALARAADGVNWVLEKAENSGRLILEVAAGSGSVIGSQMEDLARVYDRVEKKDRVGFALDSQHMWASGYDLQNELDKIVDDIERIFGLDKVWAIHLNDSKTEHASKKDRHENFGQGLIGEPALTAFLNHRKLREIPFILETPAMKDIANAKLEVEKVRSVLR